MTTSARPHRTPAGDRQAPAHRASAHQASARQPPGNRGRARPAGRKPWRRRRLRAVAVVTAAVCAVAVAAAAGLAAVRWAVTAAQSVKPPTGAAHAGSAAEGSAKMGSAGGGAPTLPPLSAAQLAGQRVIYSYQGLTPPASLLRWIRAGEVGGVIFFSQNIASETQIASVIAQLDRANASPRNPLRSAPLLLMTDQEGGLVRRLPGEPLLSEKQIGESAHPAAAARAAGTGAGRNLAGAGLNVNLAPVLDVYRTPGDFDDQFQRSYSTSPRVVSRLGADFVRAQQAAGAAATVKHFPGLGTAGASQNTDEQPVTLPVSLHTLRAVDEYPYRAAIAGGARLVMVSWAVYPALDPARPAGLSPAIAGGELRQRLGFTGVTITDALEAGALRAFGTTRNRARLAAKAGMDLILCSAQKATQGAQARIALARAYQTGALGKWAFQAAVRRILALKASLGR